MRRKLARKTGTLLLGRWFFTIGILGLGSLSLPAASPQTFLHTRGQDIVNENGDKVMLRGVGLGNWFLPEGYMWKFGNEADRPRRIEKLVNDLIGPENAKRFWSEFRKNYIAEPDIKRIAELGYNSVRPALNSRLFVKDGNPVVYSEEGFALLDNLVKWCKASGVYVIIDMHAAVGGQTGQNIDDSADDRPDLFIDPKYQDELVNLWVTIAKRYANEPAVAGYDLLNEPLPARTGAAKVYKAQLEPLYQRITKAIREVDSRHMIIVEGADWANDWSVFSKPFDKNMVYQFHYYCWDNPSNLKSIQQYLDYRSRFNAPVWVGETGERDDTIYWATTEYFESNNIGWSFWPWKKMDTRNTPYSIKTPADWEAVADYSRGGAKPSPELAQKAFDELLTNIRLENCECFPDVINSMMRRVPARIEAENYGEEGINKSYFVKNGGQHSEFYRTSEPVSIRTTGTNRWQSGQYISLDSTEWTRYTVSSDESRDCQIMVKARAASGPVTLEISVGDQARTVTLTDKGWNEIPVGLVSVAQGGNDLKCTVKSGAADVDWIELHPTEKGQRASISVAPAVPTAQ
ncbi:MAG TPA: cellulase family glycosylhydrolase [Verrucomicrobiae bacterium]|nr:cellulase family glycosylhydrolase [Verrucomicrobiae bacterium]